MTPAFAPPRPRPLPLYRALCAWAAISCASCTVEPPAGTVVAASIPPLRSLVEAVVGDSISVVSLLPPGRSPHDYDPTPAQVDRLRGAVLFVHVRDDVDGWMRKTATAVMGDGAPLLSMSEAVNDAGRDPHLWLDLEVVQAFVPLLAERLSALDPEGASGYRSRSRAFLDSLRVLDGEARDLLAGATRVPFALQHPAFLSLARRYGLNLVGVLETHPEGEARPRSLGDVHKQLQGSSAAVIFAEPQLSDRTARALATDVGAQVAVLDPLRESQGAGREAYLDLLRWNVQQLAENLHDPGD